MYVTAQVHVMVRQSYTLISAVLPIGGKGGRPRAPMGTTVVSKGARAAPPSQRDEIVPSNVRDLFHTGNSAVVPIEGRGPEAPRDK